jgi:hypothetical protein
MDVASAQVGRGRAAERLVGGLIYEGIQEIPLFFTEWHAEFTPHRPRLVCRPLLFDLSSRAPHKAGLHSFEYILASWLTEIHREQFIRNSAIFPHSSTFLGK